MFENLKSTLERIDAECVELTRDVLDSVDRELAKVQGEAMSFLDGLKAHLIQHPEPVFAILRRIKPILLIKNVALVTRFADVQEVLSRDEVFLVTYGEKMRVVTGGEDFFLGMQNSPEYTRDVSHMRSVVRREDIPGRIAPFVQKTASDLIAAAGNQIDVVKLSKDVPSRWIADYFGCPSPSEQQVEAWASLIFQYLFADQDNDPKVAQAATQAAAAVRDWLDETVAARKATRTAKDDVLGRCLALQSVGLPAMDDVSIRNNLLGLLVGAIPTTSKCCAQALDQLFERPEHLRSAQAAALADNDALLRKYVFEALRFNPNNPGLFRLAAEDYRLAKTSLHGTTIPKGTSVIAATQSAMFDERMVDQPNQFRIDRPEYLNMHFGYGLHSCFGQYVNRVQIPGILKPLLKCPGLRRAGELQYDGPFPSSLPVSLD
ncbi:MAG TPA: cytochrome P450 [Terriglobales bacterium]|nr:cytochrome P450 [Terriglobales bacterium]